MRKNIMSYFLNIILLVLISISNITPAIAIVETESENKIVKIGYYKGDARFQDGFNDNDRKSGYAYEYFQKIAALTNWDYEYVYGSRSEIIDQLVNGEIDIVAGVYQTSARSQQVLFSKYDLGLQGAPRYFAINKNREDLLEEFNQAQSQLVTSDADFLLTLQQEYYSQNSHYQTLTVAETSWLKEKGSLSIGYIQDSLPLSDQTDDGAPTGLIDEFLSWLQTYLQIPLNAVCYNNVILMEEGLRNGEIDTAFPIYSDLWLTEQKGFFQTDPFVSDRITIVYQGHYRSNILDRIALSETGLAPRYYLATHYPDSKLIYYDNEQKSFEALERGDVDCMVGCSSILQRFFTEHTEYYGYHMAQLDDLEKLCMAVRRQDNVLVGILNKAINQLDDTTITAAMIQYSNVGNDITFLEVIQHYALAVILILVIFSSLLLYIYIKFRAKTRHFNEEQEKTRAALESALSATNAANESKTTFLSNMSHDIRTPMNGIIGMTAIAAAHIDDTSRVRDCLNKITSSSKHLLSLINEILDMSKIESGQIHLNEEMIELSNLMDELITLNKPLADAKHHDIEMHILNITHEHVIGDSMRLQQIFTNLVSNAIKYTPDGGYIEITLSEKPSNNPKRGCFIFEVKDNGIGMSPEYIPHIFEAFSRESKSTHIQGTGLGMAIIRNIIRIMEGDITVQSEPGKGSTFTVTLFLKLRETETIPYDKFANLKILVVDDDQVICESTCLLLSELNMKGEWALSGREAVEKVAARHDKGDDYFAILIDWKMPELDGVETTKRIRQYVKRDVPIIIISAYDWSDIQIEALEAGADGFVEKPLFKSRLIHLFERLSGTSKETGEQNIQEMAEQLDFSGKRTLLVEDNEINAEIALEILEMTGLEADWAHNGREAVNRIQNTEPNYYDCIFMDVQMPVLNGIEATKEIRAMEREDTKTIPIFAMTANAFNDDVKAVLRAGMNEHIAKPLDFHILLKTLNEYLNR